MKPSTALQWKRLIAKIHPPLPLNPRDSQKLLGLLTDSFRKELDREHSKPTPTDVHIDSILSSPLLSPRDKDTKHETHSVNNIKFLDDLQSSVLMSTPAVYFHSQVASGHATIRTAKFCLAMELQRIRNATGKGSLTFPTESKIAISVLHWLWSSGMEESMDFVEDVTFLKDLMPFMVCQGFEDRVMEWIRRLDAPLRHHQLSKITKMDPDPTSVIESPASYPTHRISRPATALLKTKQHYQSSNAATKAFFSIVEVYDRTIGLSNSVIQKLISSLIEGIRLERCDSSSRSLDVELYDRLVAFCSDSTGSQWNLARLSLLHPSQPDGSIALKYLQGRKAETWLSIPLSQRVGFVNFCLDTAGVLLATGRNGDAAWVMEFLQKKFPKEIGYVLTHRVNPMASPSSMEENNFEGADALAIG